MCFPLLVKVLRRLHGLNIILLKHVRALGCEQTANSYPQYEHTM